jgi:hypothetical protein
VHVVVDVDVDGFLKFMFLTESQGELQGRLARFVNATLYASSLQILVGE